MSKSKSKKKVVLSKKENKGATKVKVAPTTSRRGRGTTKTIKNEKLLFGKDNFTLILAGFGLVLLGMIMMLGGSMPDPNTWDPDIIYSTRITVVGPVLIVAGLIVEIYAIFKK